MFNKNFKLTNSTLSNSINRNVVHPTTSLNHMEQREVSTNVEIVELNTSLGECDVRNDTEGYNFGEVWSYIGQDTYTDEDSYKTNRSARERRRSNREAENEDFRSEIHGRHDRSSDNIYPSFFTLDRHYPNYNDSKSYPNRQVNCFTIPNNIETPSSSSDDNNGDIEIIHCGGTIPSTDYWNNSQISYNDNEVYFSQDLETNKRTIWIYSFKNKRILCENDFVLTDIPSKESSSCTSSTGELEFEPTKEKSSGRIATPIPYIPRLNLNLTSTLPTVTEVTEPIKQSTSVSVEINQQVPSFKNMTQATNSSICNSLKRSTLSPRIKIKSTRNDEISITEREETYNEPEIIIMNREENCFSVKPEMSDQQKYSKGNKNPIDNRFNIKSDKSFLQKPHFNVTSKPLSKGVEISEPLEKLEGNWIGEDKTTDEHTIIYDYDLTNENIDHNLPSVEEETANNFFIRNMPLLKPAEWNEYMPITDRTPSIELSIITNVNTSRKSWFKKFLRCVKCFKKDK